MWPRLRDDEVDRTRHQDPSVETKPIFFDRTGKRRKLVSRLTLGATAALTLVAVAFAVTLVARPQLPALRTRSGSRIPTRRRTASQGDLRTTRAELVSEIRTAAARRHSNPVPKAPVVAAFYATWQEGGTSSLRAFAPHLTHLLPTWLHLDPTGHHLDTSDYDLDRNPKNREVLDLAHREGVRVLPLLSNAIDGEFATQRAADLLRSPSAQTDLAYELKNWLLAEGFQGVNIDLENLADEDQARLPEFIRTLKSVLGPELEVTVDVESSLEPSTMAQIAEASDWTLLMAYDQHSEGTGPGPIAAATWSRTVVDRALQLVPEDKLVLGVGSYAYDWSGKRADAATYQEALTNAAGYADDLPPKDAIDFDPGSLNSHFDYEDEAGKEHQVWMLDAASAYNQWRQIKEDGLRGAGLWALGMEDPGVWTFLDRRRNEASVDPNDLQAVQFPYGVDHSGKGEILRIGAHPAAGRRRVEIDKDTGLIDCLTYEKYPFPYVIRHSGYVPKKLAITFDDGPDPEYTPQVLDTLHDLKVPATFFVVGRNVENAPDLVRRIYDEGHEIGSHTFTHADLGAVDRRRVRLELNATQRAIQSITGHSTVLFRPPFNADSEPQAPTEVVPVDLADALGYTTVAEKIDPQDWDLSVHLPDGETRPKNADDIAGFIERKVLEEAGKRDDGNIILLHDAGGDRTQTLAALRKFVPKLRAQGFEFVPVSRLMGTDRDHVMPATSAREKFAIWMDGLVLQSAFSGEALLAKAFGLAIVLGFARVALVVPLALRRRRRERSVPGNPGARVAVLIAAFNEEKVIARTIQSVLASKFPVAEVIVVDDGSTDGTGDRVESEFAGDPRIRLVRQPNGGKASALNRACALTDAEIAVCVDADTMLDFEAIGRLVAHFTDETVAAVAGNVQVGNVHNLITSWQSVEYTTSQNLDRRAYASLNAVTVVPGAIGAWRVSALREAGGYQADTLAEDMDLTWRLRRLGYRIENEPAAYAYTEAPDTLRSFFKQRFRWAFGTLQCLVKHAGALGRYGWFGGAVLPMLWLFQIVFQALAPLIDLQVAVSLGAWIAARFTTTADDHAVAQSAQTQLLAVLGLYALFLLVEFGAGYIAYRLEKRSPRPLLGLLLQRFAYRQIMYAVIFKSLLRALTGGREGWGKLERKGSVALPTGTAALQTGSGDISQT